MIATHDIADDLGGFLESGIGVETQHAHDMQEAAMHGLQAITHIRQRAMHDSGECIGKVTLLQGMLEFDGFNRVERRGRRDRLFHDSAGNIAGLRRSVWLTPTPAPPSSEG